MNKTNIFLLILLSIFSLNAFSEGTFVLNAERAMLSTQFAQNAFKELEEDSDFIADRERLELLQTEGQELVEKFQQDAETLSDEEKLDMQKKSSRQTKRSTISCKQIANKSSRSTTVDH
jgi:Skp family chaperone for outer membrane proteins